MVYANENFWFVWRCVLIRRSKRLLTAYNLSLNGLKHQRICWSVINTQALLFSCWTKRAETFQWLVGGLVFLLENGSSQTLFLMVFWSFQSCKTTEKVQIVRIDLKFKNFIFSDTSVHDGAFIGRHPVSACQYSPSICVVLDFVVVFETFQGAQDFREVWKTNRTNNLKSWNFG